MTGEQKTVEAEMKQLVLNKIRIEYPDFYQFQVISIYLVPDDWKKLMMLLPYYFSKVRSIRLRP